MRGELGEVDHREADPEERVESERVQIGEGGGHEHPVAAGKDEQRHEEADGEHAQHVVVLVEGEHGACDDLTDNRSHGAGDEQRERRHDDEHRKLGEKQAELVDGRRHDDLLHLGLNPNGDEHRQKRRAVGDGVYRSAEEGDRLTPVDQCGERGVHEDARQHEADHRVASEVLGGTERHDEGQEVEEGVTHHVQEGVRLPRGVDEPEEHDDGEKRLVQTGDHQAHQDGGDGGRHGVERLVHPVAPVLALLGAGADGGFVGGGHQCAYRLVDRIDLVAHHHLVDAAGVDDARNFLQLLEAFLVYGFDILEFEAQACEAMRDLDDVVGAADVGDDLFGEAIVLCHDLLLSLGLTLSFSIRGRRETP